MTDNQQTNKSVARDLKSEKPEIDDQTAAKPHGDVAPPLGKARKPTSEGSKSAKNPREQQEGTTRS